MVTKVESEVTAATSKLVEATCSSQVDTGSEHTGSHLGSKERQHEKAGDVGHYLHELTNVDNSRPALITAN